MANTPNPTPTTDEGARATRRGMSCSFDAIHEPGTYVCHWSGHLLRVPQDGVAPGRDVLVNLVGAEPLFVTKLSANPSVALTKARLLASDCDLPVNF